MFLFCHAFLTVSAGTPGDVSSISPQLDRLIKQRGRDLRLRKVDQQSAVKIVNQLIESLLEFLKNNEDQPFFREISVLTSGSYYEMVKVKNINDNIEKSASSVKEGKEFGFITDAALLKSLGMFFERN